jgi:outer membrane PBP1 activator LpoA protein
MAKFAGAVQQGSAEAFDAIRAAIEQTQDPVVEATEEQTDKLLQPLENIFNAVKNGFVNKVVGNLLD